MKRFVIIAVFSVAATPAALAFHELKCGPFHTTVINEATGDRRCVETSPGAKEQFQRNRKLQQDQEKRTRNLKIREDQEKRTRDLLLRQRQRVRDRESERQQRLDAQTEITTREQKKQLRLNRRQILNQRLPARARERSQILQDGLLHQDRDAKRRGEQALESDLLRTQNLLEQQLTLPRANLLDGQKALKRRVEKDQQGQ